MLFQALRLNKTDDIVVNLIFGFLKPTIFSMLIMALLAILHVFKAQYLSDLTCMHGR